MWKFQLPVTTLLIQNVYLCYKNGTSNHLFKVLKLRAKIRYILHIKNLFKFNYNLTYF